MSYSLKYQLRRVLSAKTRNDKVDPPKQEEKALDAPQSMEQLLATAEAGAHRPIIRLQHSVPDVVQPPDTGDQSSQSAMSGSNSGGIDPPHGAPRRTNRGERHTMPHGDEWGKGRSHKGRRASGYSPPTYGHLRESTQPPPVEPDATRVSVEPDACLAWRPDQTAGGRLVERSNDMGRRTQLHSGQTVGLSDVVMGIDFGTSSTKVVLGDRGLKQSFAVPFRDVAGVAAYLLPARLFESADGYSLQTGSQVHADLKLSLLAHPDDVVRQARVVAFLALTIRLSRAWLFEVHRDKYAKSDIVWTLALGQPADHATSSSMSKLYEKLGDAAWLLAGSDVDISAPSCLAVLRKLDASPDARDNDLEVKVMPEIAAQIYGFVTSNRFDPNQRNIFLLADIGAGTVDSCLFEVKPAPGGNWIFNLFTAAVKPNGVMNLHRDRVDWWRRQLVATDAGKVLAQELEAIKLSTEHQGAIPERFDQYLRGVNVSFTGRAQGPDSYFFESHVVNQIRGNTLYSAFSRKLLDQRDLSDVPFFLCGGSRLGLYRGLSQALRKQYGFSWLSADFRELALPDDLRADGVVRSDFDRLSVAYGLSMLNVAGVTAVMPVPGPEARQHEPGWRSHYVDKDQC